MNTIDQFKSLQTKYEVNKDKIDNFSQILIENQKLQQQDKELSEDLHMKYIQCYKQIIEVQQQLQQLSPQLEQNLQQQKEQFILDQNQFVDDYNNQGPQQTNIPPSEANKRLREFKLRLSQLLITLNTIQEGEQLLGLQVSSYDNFNNVKEQIQYLDKLYSLYNNVITTINGYSQQKWQNIDFEEIQKTTMAEFQQKAQRMPKPLKQLSAFQDLTDTINNFNNLLPLLQGFKGQYIKLRHWQKLYELTQCDSIKKFYDTDQFCPKVNDILCCDPIKYIEDVEEIILSAQKEQQIETKFLKIKSLFQTYQFTFSEYKDRGLVLFNASNTSQLVDELDDNLLTIQSLKSNRFNKPFLPEILQWYQSLTKLQEILNVWLQVQQSWQYLEAVFSSQDISKQLFNEARIFQTIDKQYIAIMNQARINPRCLDVSRNDKLKEDLYKLIDRLETCQKSLSQYLEKKRSLFPRFYFCSDAILLEILGKQSDPTSIQPYLLNIFENIAKVHFGSGKNKKQIIAIEDKYGEKIELSSPVNAQGNVEDWLNNLVSGMQTTIKDIARDVCQNLNQQDIEQLIKDLYNNQPAQITLLCIQILWTNWCEQYFRKMDKQSLKDVQDKLRRLMQTLLQITKDKSLDKRHRINVETLITINVHQQDIFNEMTKQGSNNYVQAPNSFNWTKQIRYYWQPDLDTIKVSITDVDLMYQYEYIGTSDSLVITPLTDRCFITLAQALQQYLGGSPAGPAGTGKTETVKQLAKQLGTYCVVFNCSDQMNYKSLGAIFKGVSESGCYADFDEFNRIQLDVMSVAAQQISCILQAIREGKQETKYTDGSIIKVQKQCGFFITMNPGYAGRVELLENLKALFRSVAMVCQNFSIIFQYFNQEINFLIFQFLFLAALYCCTCHRLGSL